MAKKDELGRRGEDVAAEWCEAQGMRVVDRNWRCREGEIDLVALDGDEVVVVEVKTRSGTGWGSPVEAVTPVKLARLRRLAGAWHEAHPGTGRGLRIDVVGITVERCRGHERIEHVRAAGS
ncbi:putative endonuclease [Frigoribacterium sp. PhB160]|jgi:putative endonuclease|uniref:YraN family protein n=1 Tax=Frigoribacterium sp. PhB160 TaxID=2485192 RepID=UPI000F46C2B6|nr:YraN family protein [Frigoribacterium sp. PhB160]ROS61933.1 putative endonuclease [Frigoribacterium sp. PhB160]